MVVRASTLRRLACPLSLALLRRAALPSITQAEADASESPKLAVADLERLVQQLEDPQQRTQLLATSQALIVAAKQGRETPAGPLKPDASRDETAGVFLAVAEIDRRVAALSRQVGHSLAALSAVLRESPALFQQPTTLPWLRSVSMAIGILAAAALIPRFIAASLGATIQRRAGADPGSPWHRLSSAALTVGLQVLPFAVLSMVSGSVSTALPVGPAVAGLLALAIATLIGYRLCRALVLFTPGEPQARLLPLHDATAERAWGWSRRLLKMAAGYYLVTRGGLLIGVPREIYLLGRGLMLVGIAVVLSIFVGHLASRYPPSPREPPRQSPQGFWSGILSTLGRVWPAIALPYIWCAAVFALAGFRQGLTYLAVASLQMAAVLVASLLLPWAMNVAFSKGMAMPQRIGRSMPGLEARALRHLKAFRRGVRLLISGVAGLLVLQVWGGGDRPVLRLTHRRRSARMPRDAGRDRSHRGSGGRPQQLYQPEAHRPGTRRHRTEQEAPHTDPPCSAT
jgi:hypothetical protein